MSSSYDVGKLLLVAANVPGGLKSPFSRARVGPSSRQSAAAAQGGTKLLVMHPLSDVFTDRPLSGNALGTSTGLSKTQPATGFHSNDDRIQVPGFPPRRGWAARSDWAFV